MKSSPSMTDTTAKTVDDVNKMSSSGLTSNSESVGVNSGISYHQLSISSLRGGSNTTMPSMVASALSSSINSASTLQSMSFVASTPAHNSNQNPHDSSSTNADIPACSNFKYGSHDQLQSSTQIENVNCRTTDEAEASSSIINDQRAVDSENKSCELDSINETPSRFQVPPTINVKSSLGTPSQKVNICAAPSAGALQTL